jgi:hypothetical protein
MDPSNELTDVRCLQPQNRTALMLRGLQIALAGNLQDCEILNSAFDEKQEGGGLLD